MKTTVDLPDPLLEAAKAAAARDGTTLRALIEEGLRYAHREDSAHHPQARERMQSLAEGRAIWAIPWPCVQPGTWVTLLTGHMGDTLPLPAEGLSKRSAWFGWSCNPRIGATRLQVHPNHAGREG